MSMKHITKLCMASTLLALAAPYAAAQPTQVEPLPVVKVNGKAIDAAVFGAMLQAAKNGGAADSPQVRAAIRDELVARQLFLQEAASRGVDKSPEGQRVLQQARENALIELLLADDIQRNPIDDKKVRAEYDAQVAKLAGAEETHLQAMVLKTEAEAKDVVARLKKGESFEKLAREKSVDPSREQGGLIGWVLPAAVAPQLTGVMTNLAKGAYSSAPIQTPAGWNVIRIDDRRAFKVPSFEDTKSRIAQGLLQRQRNELLQRLAAGAKVE